MINLIQLTVTIDFSIFLQNITTSCFFLLCWLVYYVYIYKNEVLYFIQTFAIIIVRTFINQLKDS